MKDIRTVVVYPAKDLRYYRSKVIKQNGSVSTGTWEYGNEIKKKNSSKRTPRTPLNDLICKMIPQVAAKKSAEKLDEDKLKVRVVWGKPEKKNLENKKKGRTCPDAAANQTRCERMGVL